MKGGFQDKRPEEYSRPGLNPFLALHREFGPPVIVGEDAPAFRGRWHEAFGGREAPLHVEIGSGNGFFMAAMPQNHTDWNWLGFEIRFKRVVQTAQKIQKAGLTHARIARYDAFSLDDLFGDGDIAGLYINFPDPWPKERHARKRLLSRPFLEWVCQVLKPDGRLRIKTDHMPHVDRSVAAVDDLPLEVVHRVDDIFTAGTPWDDDVVTNYQTKFARRGEPVRALELRRLG